MFDDDDDMADDVSFDGENEQDVPVDSDASDSSDDDQLKTKASKQAKPQTKRKLASDRKPLPTQRPKKRHAYVEIEYENEPAQRVLQ
ncbi:hypothetical protein H4R35_002324 [Dimargaris xerosporica]|nr:hypothetical protein H4R35_002324 [Dimargaris xerosporica]